MMMIDETYVSPAVHETLKSLDANGAGTIFQGAPIA
jgi:hypothetical protein